MQPVFYRVVDAIPYGVLAGEVDCEEYHDDCIKMDAISFPLIKFYQYGVPVSLFAQFSRFRPLARSSRKACGQLS
jgi:hypothetical protein